MVHSPSIEHGEVDSFLDRITVPAGKDVIISSLSQALEHKRKKTRSIH